MQITNSRIESSFGKIMKFIRRKEGKFQSDIAEELGVAQTYISALENGVGSHEKYKEMIERMGYKCIITIHVDVIKEDENPLKFLVVEN
jgi:transcriptional regulator with XRE-family HTH domain